MDIIILAMVAGFIALRLYSVLGRRTGNEQPSEKPFNIKDLIPQSSNQPITQPVDNATEVVDLHPDPAQTRLLEAIFEIDRRFDPQGFVVGANGAYEMIIEAFAGGDRDTLTPLLGDDVLEGFLAAIDAREAVGQTMESKVVNILATEIIDTSVENNVAEIVVRFESEITSALRDSEDRIIDGNPSDADVINDVWTFARDAKSGDPNWLLVATEREE